MKRFLAVVFACFMAAGPASAQVNSPEQIASDFSLETLSGILTEMGFQYAQQSTPNNTTMLRVTGPSGLIFFIEPRACNSGRCVGLSMNALYQRSNPYAYEEINAYNDRYVFMKSMRLNDGSALLSRYVTADFGIPRGNIAINITVFNNLASRFPEDVDSLGQDQGQVSASAADAMPDVPSAMGFASSGASKEKPGVHAVPGTSISEITEDMINRPQ